jgi:hypothetical protein
MAAVNGSALKRAASTVIALLLLFYVGYQIYRSHHTSILTETASYYTASSSVQTTALAVRNETLLKSSTPGVISYVVTTGEKVAKGGTVARVYANAEQANAQYSLKQIDESIAKLQSLQKPGSTYSVSVDSFNSRIYHQLYTILDSTSEGNFTEAFGQKGDLLSLINEKQLVMGVVSDFGSRIASLQAQRSTLAEQAGTSKGTVVSPDSGYFIQDTDGLESACNISQVLSLSSSQVRELENTKRAPVSGSVGKICKEFGWYIACVVPADRVTEFRQLGSGSVVSVTFPSISSAEIPASVVAINQNGSDSEAAVILKCMDMDSTLAGIRCETAQIVIKKYTGIRVSQKAVHYQKVQKTVKKNGKTATETKEVEGVYILRGGQLDFRQIVPKFSAENYVICDPNPKEDSLYTDSTIKLYDEVVVEGTDLYDGKVIE